MIPRWQALSALLFKYQWNLTTVPQEELLYRPVPILQGRLLAGGSSVNIMVWGRGTPANYDAWADLGNPGWDWEGLLPYFKKVETFTPPSAEQVAQFGITWDDECHGFNGPVQSSFTRWNYPQNRECSLPSLFRLAPP